MQLSSAKRIWRYLAQSGIWLLGIISPFVLSPPDEVGADSGKLFALFSAFALSIVMGALALPLSRRHRLKDFKLWATLAIIAGICGTLTLFEYQHLRSSTSTEYDGRRIVIGSQFTREGEAYRKGEAGFTNEQAVMDAAGQPARVWTADSIRANARRLYVAYFFTVLCLSLALISAVQAAHCARKKAAG